MGRSPHVFAGAGLQRLGRFGASTERSCEDEVESFGGCELKRASAAPDQPNVLNQQQDLISSKRVFEDKSGSVEDRFIQDGIWDLLGVLMIPRRGGSCLCSRADPLLVGSVRIQL